MILFGALLTLTTAYVLGRVALRSVAAPRSLQFACGAALLSVIVFLLFIFGLGNAFAFGVVALAACGAAVFFRPAPAKDESLFAGQDRVTAILTGAVLAAYGILYFVHALAPEIQPDAANYHLGLVAEWIRLGTFPARAGFYEMLPQGPEMLFAVAFAFGGHSAAKLVHLGFFAATVPLMMAVARRLRLPPWTGAAACVFYVCAPVVGVTGASAYTDAALVLAVLAVFYSLLAWDEERRWQWLAAAGLAAGFCYSVKIPGLIVTPAAAAFVAVKSRNWKPAAMLAAAAALICAPWMLRGWLVCGNPFAPLLNGVFPNRYFHLYTEQVLARAMRSYGGVTPAQAPFEWTVSGLRLQGLIGPLFLLAPLGLLALRRREGRWLWAAAAVLTPLWFLNIGTRYLMPALPFAALALAMVLPRPLLWACAVFHAVSCWPQAIDIWNPQPFVWRLHGFPIRAALRIEPADAYLSRVAPDYRVARMLDAHVPKGQRVFALVGHAAAYCETETLASWSNAEADSLLSALGVALNPSYVPMAEVSLSWPEREFSAIKLVEERSFPRLWNVYELRLVRGSSELRPWLVSAAPNTADAPYAFDRTLASRWSSWGPARAGMEIVAEFAQPLALTGAAAVVDAVNADSAPRFYGRSKDGRWEALGAAGAVRPVVPYHLRPQAVWLLKRHGYRWLLAADAPGRHLDHALIAESESWGLAKAARIGDVYLLRAN